jgi:hypothetical protein
MPELFSITILGIGVLLLSSSIAVMLFGIFRFFVNQKIELDIFPEEI